MKFKAFHFTVAIGRFFETFPMMFNNVNVKKSDHVGIIRQTNTSNEDALSDLQIFWEMNGEDKCI